MRVKVIDGLPLKNDSENIARYQLVNNPTMVIDTFTGQVWRATGPVGGPYHFTPLCYKIKSSKLSNLPNAQDDCV